MYHLAAVLIGPYLGEFGARVTCPPVLFQVQNKIYNMKQLQESVALLVGKMGASCRWYMRSFAVLLINVDDK